MIGIIWAKYTRPDNVPELLREGKIGILNSLGIPKGPDYRESCQPVDHAFLSFIVTARIFILSLTLVPHWAMQTSVEHQAQDRSWPPRSDREDQGEKVGSLSLEQRVQLRPACLSKEGGVGSRQA